MVLREGLDWHVNAQWIEEKRIVTIDRVVQQFVPQFLPGGTDEPQFNTLYSSRTR